MMQLRHLCCGFWVVAALSVTPAAARADDEPAATQLVLYPAAEPEAALAHRLLPPSLDLRPGNAAVLYNKLAIEYGSNRDDRRKLGWRMSDWLALPPADFPVEEVRAFLKTTQKLLDDLHLAARRRQCDWELPLGERDYLSTALPELMKMRSFGQLLALDVQVCIRDHRFKDALHSLQTGFALARHVSSGGTFMHVLVALAVSGNMERVLLDWPSQPGSPNLYWALAALPRPLIDVRATIGTEGESLYWSFPELKQLESDSHSAQYWDDVLDRVLAFVVKAVDHPDDWENRLPLALLAVKGLPRAKASLADRGFSEARLQAMPVSQILLLDAVNTYKIERDRAFKRLCLAYYDGWTESVSGPRPIIPLAMVFLPAVDSYHFQHAFHERAIALLRVVEAIRAYGYLHSGELPASIDILELPILKDPVTGEPFLYERRENAAVLETPPPRSDLERQWPRKYQLRFAR